MPHPIDTKLKSFKEHLAIYLKGTCMGIADVIPGISGGTMAFLLGIYEDFILSIRSFDLNFLNRILRLQWKEAFQNVAWRFLFTLVSGIGTAIILLSKLISWLLTNTPVYINAFFFGLILATIPIILRIVRTWNAGTIFSLSIGAILTYGYVKMVPLQTPEHFLFLFLCGAVAISAMVLPGISGAFILVLLGKYHFILDAVNQRNILPLIAVAAGMGVGIISFVRFLGWLFNKFHDATITFLTGIVAASLFKIWPWKVALETMELGHGKIVTVREMNVMPALASGEFFVSLLLICAGVVIAFALNKPNRQHSSIRL